MNIIFLTKSAPCRCAVPKDLRLLSSMAVALSCKACGWAESASLSPCTVWQEGALGAMTGALADGVVDVSPYCAAKEDAVLVANNPEEPNCDQ